MRAWPEPELTLTITLVPHREHLTFRPFTAPDRISVFDIDPERISITSLDGRILEERVDPRSSYPDFNILSTPWDPVQVAYFLSAAAWN
jgi:hypothetical protein